MYLRDTLRLPALRQAQDRRRGFAPLHTPYFISLLVPARPRPELPDSNDSHTESSRGRYCDPRGHQEVTCL